MQISLVLSIICSKCGSKDEKILKEEQSSIKILCLINNIKQYQKMWQKNKIGQKLILKKIDKIRNYFIEEIKQNKSISEKHKKTCKTLDYTEHLLFLASTVTGCISISAFAYLVGIPVGIERSAAEIIIFIATTGIKKYKSIIKKKKEKTRENSISSKN